MNMTISKLTQAEKAKHLHQLHHSGKLLILPNIWDVLGAKLLEDLGYAAIATASAAVAYSNGYNDGENIPFTEVLHILCLLYTSDAADERFSVDLGGRRIIKKKK